jgi:hypothetical protein
MVRMHRRVCTYVEVMHSVKMTDNHMYTAALAAGLLS